MSEHNIEAAVMNHAGNNVDIRNFLDALLDATESHWETLRECITEEGSFDKGWDAWEKCYARAEGEEAIANIVIGFATRFDIRAPQGEG